LAIAASVGLLSSMGGMMLGVNWARITATTSALLLIVGCSGIPSLDTPNSGITVRHIVDHVQCEVFKAAVKYPRLKTQKWVAVASLYLQVDDGAGLSPNVAFIHPLAAAATSFTFNAGGVLSGTRERIYDETLSIPIATLSPEICRNDAGGDSVLTGDLGIVETVDLAFRSAGPNSGATFAGSSSSSDAFGETIQFVLTMNLNGVGPTWTLTHFTGPGGLAGVNRMNTNKLIISFAPPTALLAQSGAAYTAHDHNLRMLIQSTHGGAF
jgi:hypothetical protein